MGSRPSQLPRSFEWLCLFFFSLIFFRYVRYLARHEYVVAIEHTSGPGPTAYVAATSVDKPPIAEEDGDEAGQSERPPLAGSDSDSD